MPDDNARSGCVTPRTDPDRFTEEELALFNQGKCCWMTGFGLPGTIHCGAPSKPGASFGYCPEHEEALLEDHNPDGSPRMRYEGE